METGSGIAPSGVNINKARKEEKQTNLLREHFSEH